MMNDTPFGKIDLDVFRDFGRQVSPPPPKKIIRFYGKCCPPKQNFFVLDAYRKHD